MSVANAMVKITKQGLRFVTKNSNVILTVLSVTGVIMTVTFAVKDTIKAVKLYEEVKPVGGKQVIKTVWKCYIPTLGVFLLTTTAIICNGRINAKKLAVVTSAYGSSVEALRRMEDKMTEAIGPKKTQAIIDDVHSQSAEDNKPKSPLDIIETGNGKEVFFIEDVGQWLKTDVTHIELAEERTMHDLQFGNDWDENGDQFVTANTALEHLGARTCSYGSINGWHQSELEMLGLKGPKFRISSRRMDINGENLAVGTIWFEPEPSPI